jgi:hypothetical protein
VWAVGTTCALPVTGALFLDCCCTLHRTGVPDGIDVVVFGEGLGEFVAFAGDDVDGAVGYIGGFAHLIEVGDRVWVIGKRHFQAHCKRVPYRPVLCAKAIFRSCLSNTISDGVSIRGVFEVASF